MKDSELVELGLFHEIHVSEIREWLKCKWAWDWKFNRQYYPNKVAEPLEFGTAMHAAFEALYNPDDLHLGLEVMEAKALVAFADTNTAQKKVSLSRNVFLDKAGHDEISEEYKKRSILGIGMISYYNEVIKSETEEFVPLAVEKSFAVPITDMPRCRCNKCKTLWTSKYDIKFNGLPIALEGKIDLLLEDVHGKVWIRDWKNVANLSSNVSWIENDLQLNLYLWALWAMGVDVAGFQYFEYRKSFPEVPERLSKAYRGKMFSTSKTASHEYSSYLATVQEEDTVAYENGLYDDYLNWLQNAGPVFYRMTSVRRASGAMEMMGKMVKAYATDMILDKNMPTDLLPSPSKYGCIYCDFQQPCIEAMQGRSPQPLLDVLFTQKAPYYAETT